MRTGIVVAARPGVEELAARAEALGLRSFWVYDTPMLHGDPFMALTSCAKATSSIRLGIGVTSPASPSWNRPGSTRSSSIRWSIPRRRWPR
ncbi:LLM class flavin-dependent oxidoreductase [Nonomuraea sp. PA05]|uniref:LLM class flavin-dependent oxidoreductase n=1 Tax=Nonomuraea sp. PA05 TaxID=2604466 RepID=UPI001CA34DFF|nr:LLM class flavin-dependent oxidoreductase [Nonomuraea sp. PA05]